MRPSFWFAGIFHYFVVLDEFGAEGKDADEFADADEGGWGDDDDLGLEVEIYINIDSRVHIHLIALQQ